MVVFIDIWNIFVLASYDTWIRSSQFVGEKPIPTRLDKKQKIISNWK